MEEVIRKLSEIERTAKRIMEGAQQEKEALAEESKKHLADYDNMKEAEISAKIQEIRSTLEKDKENQLNSLRHQTEEFIEAMDQYYEENHKQLAESIYQRILKA